MVVTFLKHCLKQNTHTKKNMKQRPSMAHKGETIYYLARFGKKFANPWPRIMRSLDGGKKGRGWNWAVYRADEAKNSWEQEFSMFHQLHGELSNEKNKMCSSSGAWFKKHLFQETSWSLWSGQCRCQGQQGLSKGSERMRSACNLFALKALHHTIANVWGLAYCDPFLCLPPATEQTPIS